MSTANNKQKIPIKDIIQLRKLITSGKEAKVNYQIEFYKEIYEKDITITLRPLSNSEFDDLFLDMCNSVEDPNVLEELYNPKQKESKTEEQKEGIKQEEEKEFTNIEKEKITKHRIAYSKALKYYKNLIILTSMKDFIEGLTINDIKQLESKNDVYDKICEISGRTDEIMKKISRFRELRSRSKSDPVTQ